MDNVKGRIYNIFALVNEFLNFIRLPFDVDQSVFDALVHPLNSVLDQGLLDRVQARDDLIVVIHNQFQANRLNSVNVDFIKNLGCRFGHFQVEQFEVPDFS